jgi:hypothetical protein
MHVYVCVCIETHGCEHMSNCTLKISTLKKPLSWKESPTASNCSLCKVFLRDFHYVHLNKINNFYQCPLAHGITIPQYPHSYPHS